MEEATYKRDGCFCAGDSADMRLMVGVGLSLYHQGEVTQEQQKGNKRMICRLENERNTGFASVVLCQSQRPVQAIRFQSRPRMDGHQWYLFAVCRYRSLFEATRGGSSIGNTLEACRMLLSHSYFLLTHGTMLWRAMAPRQNNLRPRQLYQAKQVVHIFSMTCLVHQIFQD